MRAPDSEPSAEGRSTDWRAAAAELTGVARRIGTVPMLVGIGALVGIVVVGFLAGVRHGAPAPIDLPSASQEAPSGVATTQPALLRVHLAGAVMHPGLYEVRAGLRVGQLVEEAGGLRSDADAAAVNLAERLRDGQQVHVPREGEEPPALDGTPGAIAKQVIDVNAANAAQLQALPGIGPSLAAAIVAYRTEHGPFGTVDALEDVPGIGPAKLSQLRQHAKV